MFNSVSVIINGDTLTSKQGDRPHKRRKFTLVTPSSYEPYKVTNPKLRQTPLITPKQATYLKRVSAVAFGVFRGIKIDH